MTPEHEALTEWVVQPLAEGFEHIHTPLCGNHDRIVVGVDGTVESVAALRWAGEEAQLRGTHLHVVHAWQQPGGFPARTRAGDREERARDALQRALSQAFPRLTVPVESLTAASPAAELLVAASHGAALMAVGSHERGPFGQLFKSVARRAAAFATCPVAVVRKTQADRVHSGLIVVGVDDSFTSRDALHWAAAEAIWRHAELAVAHLAWLRPGIMPWTLLEEQGQLLAYLVKETLVGPLEHVPHSIIACQGPDGPPEITEGDVLHGIAAHADLLVVGSHGYGSASGALIGSVTSDCLREAVCPVVVIPDSREDQRKRIRDAMLAIERESAQAVGATVYPPSGAGPHSATVPRPAARPGAGGPSNTLFIRTQAT